MLHVLTERGEAYLAEDFNPQRLSWDEVKSLKGSDVVGLPIGSNDGSEEARVKCLLLTSSSDGGDRSSSSEMISNPLKSHCFKFLEEARSRYEANQLPWSEERLTLGFPSAECIEDDDDGSVKDQNGEIRGKHSDQVLPDLKSKKLAVTRADVILGTDQTKL